MPEYEVAVIICHHRGRELISRCLDSVQKSRGVTFQTIVITSDPAYSQDCPAWVTLYYEEGGPAHKRNVGAKFSKGKYLVFLDDDVILSAYTIYELWANMEDRPKVGMGFCKIYNAERRRELDDCGSFLTPTGFLWARAGNAQEDKGQFDIPCKILSSKSATCIIRRDLFFRIGQFDSDFFILAEETQLAYRVWLSELEVWYFPSAKSWHWFNTNQKPKTSYYTNYRVFQLGSRNYFLFLLTCLELKHLLYILPLHLAIWIISIIGFILRGNIKIASEITKGIWWIFPHFRLILQKRLFIQQRRRVSDRLIFEECLKIPPLSYYTGRLKRYWTQQTHG